MFTSIGYDVMFAKNGAEGLKFFKEHKPELILSDYSMPGMTGLDMFEYIKEISPSAKFILMTMYTESDVLIRAINLGVNRFLEKPVHKIKLQEVVSALVDEINISKKLIRYQNLMSSYRAGVDASGIFSILDPEGCFTHVNYYFCEISGYSEEELLGKHYSFIRKDRKINEIRFKALSDKSKEKMWKGCVVNNAKSGEEYITEVSLLPVLNEGKVTEFISIEKDMSFVISNHIKQLQQFFDADSSIMYAYGQSMKLSVTNKAFLNFFCYGSLSEAVENDFSLSCFIENDNEHSANHQITSTQDGDVLNIELENAAQGAIVKINLVKPDDKKTYTFTLDVFRLDQSYLGLEDLDIIRLNDITELENLRKDELNRAMLASIGKLSAGITHEINTPLTYIKGNMELLEWQVEDSVEQGTFEEMKDFFNSINDGIDRIGLIIQSMKEVTGEVKFELEKINLYSTFIVSGRMVLNRAKHICPIYINGTLLSMESDPNKEIFEIEASPKMLEQLWIILLNNSLDQLTQCDFAFDKKYIKIEIIPESEGRYKIIIADNGGGIDKDMAGKLFDLFASSKKHKGMGIGLNIAKSIIDKHNGTIKPYNSEEGAVFEILL
ncbi:MAG: hypothetical protein C0602_12125 [Denitrovibrio sp.]|nr:MAG: hypothetical protein C0602_12125 [Denitrovibrio sp.]